MEASTIQGLRFGVQGLGYGVVGSESEPPRYAE